MGTMSQIHAAMTEAGELARYESKTAELEAVTIEIDALRAAPFADDREYKLQMSEISFLQLRRRHLRASTSRMLDAFAGRIARSAGAA